MRLSFLPAGSSATATLMAAIQTAMALADLVHTDFLIVRFLQSSLRIEYEGFHPVCFHCGMYGHRIDSCPGLQYAAWIHTSGAAPSSLHQRVKYAVEGPVKKKLCLSLNLQHSRILKPLKKLLFQSLEIMNATSVSEGSTMPKDV